MTDVLNGVGEPGSTLVSVMNQMWSQLLPTPVPAQTGMGGLGTITEPGPFGQAPSDTMASAIINNIMAQGTVGVVPFNGQITEDFSILVSGDMAFVDTSVVSTEEALNDMMMENPIAATPWDDGSEKFIQQYDPLFTFTSDRKATSPGFHTLATPVIINQIQARLMQTERDAAIFGLSAPGRNRMRQVVNASSMLAVDKRIRLIEARTPFDRVRPGTQQQVVDSSRLEALRYYGSLTAEGLYAKLNFLGAVTQIWDSSGDPANGNSVVASASALQGRSLLSERVFNYSHHNRGKIANVFAPTLERGDQIFFSIANYSREALQEIGVVVNNSTNLGKRAAEQSSYVGAVLRAASADEFVQIRGWSSREGRQYLGDTSPFDALCPEVADRLHCERVHLAATQFRFHRFNDVTDEIEEVNIVGQEGMQEAIASLPDLIIENFLTANVTIPVGTVKERLPQQTTMRAILNAHYDSRALALQPHVEIYQNA